MAAFGIAFRGGFKAISAAPPAAVSQDAVQQPEGPRPVYSGDLNDPWNRIFYCLFTRRLQTRFSDEFPGGAPYVPFDPVLHLRMSTRTFERVEVGDHAIDPLYSPPAGTLEGSRQLLIEPRYSMFIAAVQEALRESTERPAIARAWMQTDLWSAYDDLYWNLIPVDSNTELDRHKQNASDLVAQLIKKIALTPEEINSLPDNYAAAMSRYALPDLFGADVGWIEIQSLPDRIHDVDAEYRRAARVFVKPSHTPQDIQKFLNALRDHSPDSPVGLDGAALVIQPLLTDSRGTLRASHLSSDVQIRFFARNGDGTLQRTRVQQYELSRNLVWSDPGSGGLAAEDENSSTYLSAGGSYAFAEPAVSRTTSGDEHALPLVVKLRTRCSLCHGENIATLMTFNFARRPGSPPPPIKQLDRGEHQVAGYDIAKKTKRAEWKRLHSYFVQVGNSTL